MVDAAFLLRWLAGLVMVTEEGAEDGGDLVKLFIPEGL